MTNKINRKEWFKGIDGKKLHQYCAEHKIIKADLCRAAGLSKSTIHDAIRREECRIVNMNALCDVLEVPRDYFDKVEEPEIIPETPKASEEEINVTDLADMVDLLKDIVISIKNQQAIEIKLLTEIGRTLAGFEGIVVKREEKEGWTAIKR